MMPMGINMHEYLDLGNWTMREQVSDTGAKRQLFVVERIDSAKLEILTQR